jgi:hypothetical protein
MALRAVDTQLKVMFDLILPACFPSLPGNLVKSGQLFRTPPEYLVKFGRLFAFSR